MSSSEAPAASRTSTLTAVVRTGVRTRRALRCTSCSVPALPAHASFSRQKSAMLHAPAVRRFLYLATCAREKWGAGSGDGGWERGRGLGEGTRRGNTDWERGGELTRIGTGTGRRDSERATVRGDRDGEWQWEAEYSQQCLRGPCIPPVLTRPLCTLGAYVPLVYPLAPYTLPAPLCAPPSPLTHSLPQGSRVRLAGEQQQRC